MQHSLCAAGTSERFNPKCRKKPNIDFDQKTRGAADRGRISPSCRSCCEVVSPDYLRLLGRRTRKYLKATRPSPAGNRASHFRQRILPCTTSSVSTLTILYSASQDGQRKGTGSDGLIVKKDRVAENRNVLGSSNESGAHEGRHARAVPTACRPSVSHSTPRDSAQRAYW